MEHSQTKKFGWGFLILGILFIFCALLAFFSPASNLAAIAYFFAILAIIDGIWQISRFSISGWHIVIGIIDILIGVFMLFNISWTMLALPYIFAIWFIADSLFRLTRLGVVRALYGTGYMVFSLILNILGVVVGILLLFEPVTAALTLSFLIGFYLLLAGIEFVFLAFPREQ